MIFLLTWEYTDKSGHGVVRAYYDEKRATADLVLLEENGHLKIWKILALPVTE